MRFLRKYLILVFACTTLFYACEDDGTYDVDVNFKLSNNGESVELNETVTLSTGESVQFTRADFYVSELTFTGDGEGIADSIFLFKLTESDVETTKVNAGKYSALSFGLGMQESWNAIDPATFPNKHPMGLDNSSMYWTWNTGYRFFVLEGKSDLDADGTFENVFVYHIGTNPFFRNVIVPGTFDIGEKESNTINLAMDIETLFRSTNDIDLETENSSHSTGDGVDVADRLVENITLAFETF